MLVWGLAGKRDGRPRATHACGQRVYPYRLGPRPATVGACSLTGQPTFGGLTEVDLWNDEVPGKGASRSGGLAFRA